MGHDYDAADDTDGHSPIIMGHDMMHPTHQPYHPTHQHSRAYHSQQTWSEGYNRDLDSHHGPGSRVLPPRFPVDRANSYSPTRGKNSPSGHGHGLSRAPSRSYQRQSSGGSVRSLATFSGGDYLADPDNGSSPDKAFREARKARLESQASMASEAARIATAEADRIAAAVDSGSSDYSHSHSSGREQLMGPGARENGTAEHHTPSSTSSLPRKSSRRSLSKARSNVSSSNVSSSSVASGGVSGGRKRGEGGQVHEKAYLAATRARDASFLAHAEAALYDDDMSLGGEGSGRVLDMLNMEDDL
jgi:hypothetical protein